MESGKLTLDNLCIFGYPYFIMNDSLSTLNLTQLNLDDATRELIQRLLNHIETLEAECQELREENQRLQDLVQHLKGQKPKPQFKANRPPLSKGDESTSAERASPKPGPTKVPRAERIQIDREEVVSLDRSQLPPDFECRGYRDVIIQNLRFQTDNVRYRLERGSSAGTGEFFEAKLPQALQGESFGPELQAFVLFGLGGDGEGICVYPSGRRREPKGEWTEGAGGN